MSASVQACIERNIALRFGDIVHEDEALFDALINEAAKSRPMTSGFKFGSGTISMHGRDLRLRCVLVSRRT